MPAHATRYWQVPASIGGLSKLETLYLAKNPRLTSIPANTTRPRVLQVSADGGTGERSRGADGAGVGPVLAQTWRR